MRRLKRWYQELCRGHAADPSVIDVSLLKAWTGSPKPRNQDLLQTPQLLKTRIAREVAVAVVVRADRPISRSEVLEHALVDPKVQSASVSRGTVSAELAAALAEDPPRIIRLCRGIYASAEVKTDASDAGHSIASASQTNRPVARAAS